MKYYKAIAVFIAQLILLPLFSQGMQVLELKTTDPIPVYDPLVLDSLNVDRKTYEVKSLLSTELDMNLVRESQQVITAGGDSVFTLPFAPYNPEIKYRDKAIQLLMFRIDADRYCKASLTITATDLLEVYVDGKKEKTKETKENKMDEAKKLTINLTLEPQQKEVIIKRLAQVRNFDEAGMKIALKLDTKFPDAQITLSTGGKRRITIDDILEGERVTANALSPSGKYYINSLREVFSDGKGRSIMELREVKSNKLLYRFPASIGVQWLNKEDKFIFSRVAQTDKDLYIFDLATLEETRIAESIKYDAFRIAPDNQFLIITRKEEIPADKGNLKRTLSPSDRSGAFRGRNTLWRYELTGGHLMQRLTFGKADIVLNDIHPDSQKMLILASEETTERPFHTSRLLEVDLVNLSADTLLTDKYLSGGKYSPDGKYIFLTGAPEAFAGIGQNVKEGEIANSYDRQAYLYNVKTKEIKPLTRDFAPSVDGVQWSEYDNKLYFRVQDKDCQAVYSYDLASEKFTKLPLPEDIVTSFQLSYNSPTALFRGESPSNSFRLYAFDLKTEKSTLLSDPFKERLDQLDLTPVTNWSFQAEDGTTVEGRYYLPYGYDPSQKYPMIVYYYGGTSPTGRIFESTYPMHTYAALGYTVLVLNPSGTTGWGQEYSARHVNAWGEYTANEIIQGTRQFCREHAFVDSTKLGCIGASYGGFMTQYIITQSDLFAAAISHAGISNIASYWGEGYWGYSYSTGASAHSYPWNNPKLYVEQSPLFQADKINTPLLLLHGSADTNVPVGESVQMFNALRLLGKEVEFIQVEGENHAIYEHRKRIEWNKTIHAWFARWLKDQPEWWESLYPTR